MAAEAAALMIDPGEMSGHDEDMFMDETEAAALAAEPDLDTKTEDGAHTTPERRADGTLVFCCSECGKRFNHRGTANRHLLTHTNAREFACVLCPARFHCRDGLRQHELIHSGERPHACDQCDQTFRAPANLKVHKRLHADIRPFTCEECGRTFRAAFNLQRHHARAHQPRPGSRACSKQCGRIFSSEATCAAHELKCARTAPAETPEQQLIHAPAALSTAVRRIGQRNLTRQTQNG
jgi:hypothetical protein